MLGAEGAACVQEHFQKLLPSIRLLPRVEQEGFGCNLESSIQFRGPHGHSDAGTVSSSDFSIQISAIFNLKKPKKHYTTKGWILKVSFFGEFSVTDFNME